jgi:hypothetical protein
MLLDKFYSSFEKLYGRGSCGINVHNAGAHLIYYVKKLGPLWAWSCFSFEDCNAVLLQTVHGTGNVLKQVMRIRECQAHLLRVGLQKDKSTMWKVTHEAMNCDVAGGLKDIKRGDLSDEIRDKLGIEKLSSIKRADRIMINGRKIHAATYSRMKKRTCNAVLYDNNKIGLVKYFVLCSNVAYAIVEGLDKKHTHPLNDLLAGKHVVPVLATETTDVVLAGDICENLFYVCTNAEQNDDGFVVKRPNRHGHAVFK